MHENGSNRYPHGNSGKPLKVVTSVWTAEAAPRNRNYTNLVHKINFTCLSQSNLGMFVNVWRKMNRGYF